MLEQDPANLVLGDYNANSEKITNSADASWTFASEEIAPSLISLSAPDNVKRGEKLNGASPLLALNMELV